MPDFLDKTVDKFTFRVATDRLYSSEGVWARQEAGGRVRVGIADYVQQHSGDVAFVSLKPPGTRLAAGDELAEFETVKTTFGLASPLSGTVAEVNAALDTTPEVINDDPYGRGWLATIAAENWESDRVKLLDAAGYFSVMESQVREALEQ